MLLLLSWGSLKCVEIMNVLSSIESRHHEVAKANKPLRCVACLAFPIALLKSVAVLVFVLFMMAGSLLHAQSNNILVESPKRGVAADLVDAGDYYLHPNGNKVNFYRKKDVYALKQSNARSISGRGMAQIKAAFGNRVTQIKNHRLGDMTLVRVNNQTANRTQAQFSNIAIDGNALVAGNVSFDEAEPVLASATGNGDVLITNRLLLKLASGVEAERTMERLTKRFGLSIIRKVNVSGDVYLVENKARRDVSERFTFVRRVSGSPLVAWAQPQFTATPVKTQFNPANDELFSQQWHLSNTGFRGSLCAMLIVMSPKLGELR